MRENGDLEALARSVEDVHHLRLMALLEDLVREKDRTGAAEALGVDPRTLLASLGRGALSVRMRVALDHMLISGGTSAAGRQRERFETLERELAALRRDWEEREKGLRTVIAGEVRVVVEAAKTSLREEFSLTVAELPRTTAPPESAHVEAGPSGVDGPKNQKPRPARSHRLSRGVVTREPHPGEEDSYGEGMDSVNEWRELNRKRGAGSKLEQVRVRQWIMELEIEIIGEHKLTLPPNTEPLHQSEREGYLGWRRRALLHMQRERLRRELVRWVRMALTLCRWKG